MTSNGDVCVDQPVETVTVLNDTPLSPRMRYAITDNDTVVYHAYTRGLEIDKISSRCFNSGRREKFEVELALGTGPRSSARASYVHGIETTYHRCADRASIGDSGEGARNVHRRTDVLPERGLYNGIMASWERHV